VLGQDFQLFDSKRRLHLADLRWATLEFVNHLLYLVPVHLALLVLLALLALLRINESIGFEQNTDIVDLAMRLLRNLINILSKY
jgi:hypothetical protein